MIIDDLPRLIANGEIDDKIKLLPRLEINEERLDNKPDKWRAYVVLTFIGQGFLWRDGENPTDTVPAVIAVPWANISKDLGMPPVATHATACLFNFALRDRAIGFTDIHNIYPLVTYTDLKEESFLYAVALMNEIKAAPGLHAVLKSYKAMKKEDNDELLKNLLIIKESIESMAALFKLIKRESTDPVLFFERVLPFQRGHSDIRLMKKHDGKGGVVFQEVSEEPKHHGNASAAESSTLPVFDAFLGVVHDGVDTKALVSENRRNMPPLHRKLISIVEEQPSARDYVTQSNNKELIGVFDEIKRKIKDFRHKHHGIASTYMLQQIPSYAEARKTTLSHFLKGMNADVK